METCGKPGFGTVQLAIHRPLCNEVECSVSCVVSYVFLLTVLVSPTLAWVQEEGLLMILNSPTSHQNTGSHNPAPWTLPIRRNLLSQARQEIFHPHPQRLALCEWFNLRAGGLPPGVTETIQNARTPSTRSLNGRKWSIF